MSWAWDCPKVWPTITTARGTGGIPPRRYIFKLKKIVGNPTNPYSQQRLQKIKDIIENYPNYHYREPLNTITSNFQLLERTDGETLYLYLTNISSYNGKVTLIRELLEELLEDHLLSEYLIQKKNPNAPKLEITIETIEEAIAMVKAKDEELEDLGAGAPFKNYWDNPVKVILSMEVDTKEREVEVSATTFVVPPTRAERLEKEAMEKSKKRKTCLLYTSDAADE